MLSLFSFSSLLRCLLPFLPFFFPSFFPFLILSSTAYLHGKAENCDKCDFLSFPSSEAQPSLCLLSLGPLALQGKLSFCVSHKNREVASSPGRPLQIILFLNVWVAKTNSQALVHIWLAVCFVWACIVS